MDLLEDRGWHQLSPKQLREESEDQTCDTSQASVGASQQVALADKFEMCDDVSTSDY